MTTGGISKTLPYFPAEQGWVRADAVLVLVGGVFLSQRKQIIDLAVKSRLPAIYGRPEFVEHGGLMTYGVNVADLYRRSLHRQNFEGYETCRAPRGAADEVRVHHQSESGQADRSNHSAQCVGASGSSNTMIKQSRIVSVETPE